MVWIIKTPKDSLYSLSIHSIMFFFTYSYTYLEYWILVKPGVGKHFLFPLEKSDLVIPVLLFFFWKLSENRIPFFNTFFFKKKNTRIAKNELLKLDFNENKGPYFIIKQSAVFYFPQKYLLKLAVTSSRIKASTKIGCVLIKNNKIPSKKKFEYRHNPCTFKLP